MSAQRWRYARASSCGSPSSWRRTRGRCRRRSSSGSLARRIAAFASASYSIPNRARWSAVEHVLVVDHHLEPRAWRSPRRSATAARRSSGCSPRASRPPGRAAAPSRRARCGGPGRARAPSARDEARHHRHVEVDRDPAPEAAEVVVVGRPGLAGDVVELGRLAVREAETLARSLPEVGRDRLRTPAARRRAAKGLARARLDSAPRPTRRRAARASSSRVRPLEHRCPGVRRGRTP